MNPREEKRPRLSFPTMNPPPALTTPFTFPLVHSTVLPDPSRFFTPNLLSSPLPTNSFFQNFALNNAEQPEYIHPYLIKSSNSSLSVSYPSRFFTSAFICQVFVADLTISAVNNGKDCEVKKDHKISSFNDLSVTLDVPPGLRFLLVRGSPYITCEVCSSTQISISTIHAILSISSNSFGTKHKIHFNNNQTWIMYSSSPLNLDSSLSSITFSGFSGALRFAILPDSDPSYESVLDQYSSCYPVSGEAVFGEPFSLEYKWEKKGLGDLLLLAHPLHVQLLSKEQGGVSILKDFKYKSVDGDLVGVVGDSWMLKTKPVPVTWHSIGGVQEESIPEIVSALRKDVKSLNTPITTSSSYFYGKLIARAARFALIAEEVSCPDVIPRVEKYLKARIEPWLDGTLSGNGFLYESKWGGLVTKQGAVDSGADFGFGVYNDHHYHLGYFLYGIAVLAKIDPAWGSKYKPQAYSLIADFMNLDRQANSNYPRLRNFDLWKLHSWAGGVTEFGDGRNQESTSEAVNGYYAAALFGLSYGDARVTDIGSTLAAFEIEAMRTWWHVREGEGMYEDEFAKANKVVGMVWANKRDSGLWFAPPEWKECRLGIQLLPIVPISEVVFSDRDFTRELVEWTMPALRREGVGDGWKGFVYALEGVYDKKRALKKIKILKEHDDGNSLSNLLWWIHSRSEVKEAAQTGGSWLGNFFLSLFRHYD